MAKEPQVKDAIFAIEDKFLEFHSKISMVYAIPLNSIYVTHQWRQKNKKLFNIVAIVNTGFSDKVMEVAKDNGTRGGTIIQANGSVSDNAMKRYV